MKTIDSRLTRQHFGNIRYVFEELQIAQRGEYMERLADLPFLFSKEALNHISEACRDIANSTDFESNPIAVIVK